MEVNGVLCMNISYNPTYYSIEYFMKKGSVLLFVGWFVSSCGLYCMFCFMRVYFIEHKVKLYIIAVYRIPGTLYFCLCLVDII